MNELFTRLTFNENNWIIPSGYPWKKVHQGKPNIPYENQYGFGHEEWLLNTRYLIDGYQFGYIRGLRRFHSPDNIVDKVHLYTVKKDDSEKFIYYLGYIENVQLLGDNWVKDYQKAKRVFNEFSNITVDEVEKSKGDITGLAKDEFIPVVRFKTENALLFEEPILIENFPLFRYKRFQPYRITDEILAIFSNVPLEKKRLPFRFNPWKVSQTERFTRYSSASEKSIIKIHSKIIDKLEQFLKPDYSLSQENISIETTRFMGNIADVVTLESNGSISIYEIKTNVLARKNIREALAQLLDYASHSVNVKVNKLVIVSPSKLDDNDFAFLKELQKVIKHPISYYSFNEESKHNFKIYE